MLIPIISAVQDTFSHKSHSNDFIYARSEYMRLRIKTIVVIFLFLMPLWIVLDWYLLPSSTISFVMMARAIMLILFLGIYIINEKKWKAPYTGIWLSYLIITIPALFYLLVLFISKPEDSLTLVGYSFIPFFLVGTLSIFPFTVLESLVLGTALLILQFFSFSFQDGPIFIWENTQTIWLLAALLVIIVSTNHFHLSLLLRLYRQATYDSLTGLLNRITLSQHLQKINDYPHRESVAVLFFDLDFFKAINDKYGHSVGDEVLRQFGALLKQETGRTEVVYRYGGEEFLVISQHSSKAKAVKLAQQILSKTKQIKIPINGQEPISITTSIGVAFLKDDESVENCIQRADQRMYQAKKQGRAQVVYKSMPEE